MRLEAARSAGWILVESLGVQVLALATFLVMARMLSPSDYGLMALALGVVSVPAFILNNGLVPVLVQRETLSDADLSTAFWTSIGIGIVLTALILLVADPIAWALHNPRLASVLKWTSLMYVTLAIGNVPSALYMHRLQYPTFVIRSLIAVTSGGCIGIVMAIQGYGVYALVGNTLCQPFISAVVLWFGVGWRPRFQFDVASFYEMRNVTAHTILGNLLTSVTTKIDMLIIGAYDPTILGYYYFVQRLLLIAGSLTHGPIGNILVPVLSRLQDDRHRLTSTYIFLLWTAQAFWAPAVAGMGAIGPVLIHALFGAKWLGATPLLQIMALTAFTACFSQYTYSVLLTTDRAELYPKLTVAQLIGTIVAFLIAAQFGMTEIGWAYVIVSATVAAMHVYVIRPVLDVPMTRLFARFAPINGAVIIMALGVIWLGSLMSSGISGWAKLLVQVASGVMIYTAIVFVIARSDAHLLLSTLVDLALGASKRLRALP